MKTKGRILAWVLAVILVIAGAIPAGAAGEEPYIRELISYYSHYQEDAQLDIQLLLAELTGIDATQAAAWEYIMGYWSHVNTQMDVSQTQLPPGLPEDDSLCILVLGYQLEPDGRMRKELVGRLETALAAAEQYPNAYIACTGGPTASGKRQVSEAGEMARWLADHGVDRERIIVEDRSRSTLENARYTCEILYDQYPRIRQLAVVTSDYHLKRSCLYFAVQAQLEGLARGEKPLTVTGTGAWQTSGGYTDDLYLQAEGVAELAGVEPPGRKAPELSRLTHIRVSGETQWPVGVELALRVRAIYTSGRSRDVTYGAKLSGFDLGAPGHQQVQVTYQEDGQICTAMFDVELLEMEAAPREGETATAVAEAVPEATEPAAEPKESGSPVWLLLLFPAVFLLWKGWKKKQ